MVLVEIGGVVAEELHGIAAFDEGEALCQQAFEFDRADFRAVLLLLAALLGALIVVEFALDAAGGAMEQVDGRPQQVVEIGFEASVTQRRDQGIEDVGDGATDDACLGQRTRIGAAPRAAGAQAEDGGRRLFCLAMQSRRATRLSAWDIRRRKIAAARRCGPGPPAVRSPSRRPRARLSLERGFTAIRARPACSSDRFGL